MPPITSLMYPDEFDDLEKKGAATSNDDLFSGGGLSYKRGTPRNLRSLEEIQADPLIMRTAEQLYQFEADHRID